MFHIHNYQIRFYYLIENVNLHQVTKYGTLTITIKLIKST